jgi:endonuclease G
MIAGLVKTGATPQPVTQPNPAACTDTTRPTPAPSPVTVTATPAPGAAAPVAVVLPAPPGPGQLVSDMKDPAQCVARYQGIDLPRHRSDGVASAQRQVCRRGYMLSYNTETHDPDWVLERLTAGDLRGPAKRTNNFRPDPLLVGLDADKSDYIRTGCDRGHQAPAADAKFDPAVMDQSFVFSNMAPQVGVGFNQGAWRFLEDTVRGWVLCGGHPDLFVITGPIYDPTGKNRTIGARRVAVPSYFYKIAYDRAAGRAVGFILPNANIGSKIDDLRVYIRPISDIEAQTGLDFFAGQSFRDQSELEDHAGNAWGHAGNCTLPSDGG